MSYHTQRAHNVPAKGMKSCDSQLDRVVTRRHVLHSALHSTVQCKKGGGEDTGRPEACKAHRKWQIASRIHDRTVLTAVHLSLEPWGKGHAHIGTAARGRRRARSQLW